MNSDDKTNELQNNDDINNTNSDNMGQETRSINGKPLYYNTSQVASILDITDSAVRFYCTKFKDVIKIETQGKNRRFKQEDIDKLKYITKLIKEDGLTIAQALEFTSETNSNVLETKIQRQEPLALQTLATALTIEIGSMLEDFKDEIAEQLIQQMKTITIKQFELQEQQNIDILNQVTEQVSNQVDILVQEKLESFQNNISEKIDDINTKEIESEKRDLELVNLLKERLDKQQENIDSLNKMNEQSSEKKGLWSRVFGK